MLYLIEAKVDIRVAGISGPFQQIVGWLVNSSTGINEAKQKFEQRVRVDYAHMVPQSIAFDYVRVVGEIK